MLLIWWLLLVGLMLVVLIRLLGILILVLLWLGRASLCRGAVRAAVGCAGARRWLVVNRGGLWFLR